MTGPEFSSSRFRLTMIARSRELTSGQVVERWMLCCRRGVVGISAITLLAVGPGCSDGGTEPPANVVAVISGQAHAVDNGSLASLWAIWRPVDGSKPDSAQLVGNGVFEIRVTSTSASGELQIGGSDGPAYHPFLFPFDVGQLSDVEIVMIPRHWTVQRGVFAGQSVPTSLDLVVDDNADQYLYSYFFGQPFPRDAPGLFLLDLMTWPQENFPARVAIDRQNSTYDLTPEDSADIWGVLNRIETVLGFDLFEPVDAGPSWWPVPTGPFDQDRVPGVIRIVSHPPNWGGRPQSGEDPVTWERDLGAWAGESRFRALRMNQRYLDAGTLVLGALEPLRLADGLIPWETVLIHEMLHVLGVGHTCRIESPMGPCLRTAEPSRFDAAYMELLRETIRLQRDLETPLGVMPGVVGERRLLLGVPPLPAGTRDGLDR